MQAGPGHPTRARPASCTAPLAITKRAQATRPRSNGSSALSYVTTRDLDDTTYGEDFSWLQYVGIDGNGMASTLDLYRLGPDFAMPVFMVQGRADLVTVSDVARKYFDSLSAPRKQFFLLERVGHDPNEAMLATQLDILRRLAGPLAD